MRYERTCNNDLYVTVVPPSTGYRPAAASADWTDLQKRIRSVSWQDGINKAVVWFDDYVTGTLGFTILWVKGYD